MAAKGGFLPSVASFGQAVSEEKTLLEVKQSETTIAYRSSLKIAHLVPIC
jgi:hypothetical protein